MTNLTSEKKSEVSKGLRGHSLMPLLRNPKTSVRDGALFCYEMLSMSTELQDKVNPLGYLDAFNKGFGKGMARGIVTTDGYKFVRYFYPTEFNKPATFDTLIASNDVQVFNLNVDPDETNNLASKANREANKALIMELNGKLNDLIGKEIGADTGAEVNVEQAIKALKDFIKQQQQQQQ